MDIELIEQKRGDLEEAVQAYMSALHSGAVTIDWLLTAEVHTAGDQRTLAFGTSATMTPWCLLGLSQYAEQMIENFVL